MVSIKWTFQARDDLKSIAEYVRLFQKKKLIFWQFITVQEICLGENFRNNIFKNKINCSYKWKTRKY